jgi:hypothetical protein
LCTPLSLYGYSSRIAISAAPRTLDESAHGTEHREQLWRVGVSLPLVQGQRVHLSETKRRLHVLKRHRQVHPAQLRCARLIVDELAFGAEGGAGPANDHATGRLQLLEQPLAPQAAALEINVPPDVEPMGLQRLGQ